MESAFVFLCDTSTILESSKLPPTLSPTLSEDDFVDVRRKRDWAHRTHSFVTVTIPGYKDEEFRLHFRLKRTTFDLLFHTLGPVMQNNEVGRRRLDAEAQLLMTLWAIATPECFRSVADRLGLERGNACRIFHRVVESITGLKYGILHNLCTMSGDEMELDPTDDTTDNSDDDGDQNEDQLSGLYKRLEICAELAI